MNASRHPGPDGLWYVRRGTHVGGPFRWEVVARHIALGRIGEGDWLSQDARDWRPLAAVIDGVEIPIVVPGSSADERRGERRHGDRMDALEEGRLGGERRRAEDADVVARRVRSEQVWGGFVAPALRARLPLLLVGLTLAVALALAVRWTAPAVSAPDCAASAGPGVNWDFCARAGTDLARANLAGMSARNARLGGAALVGANLRDADFAYADLSGADLSLAEAPRARLVGATLRKARLNHARLAGADLSFADLTGADIAGTDFTAARLANTIWTDGRVCARDAVGVCSPP